MIQKFFVAFIPVFVAIDPIGLVAIFMGLASSASPEQRKRQAALGIFTAFCVAIGFVFLGQIIFDALGITDADFQVAGGLILLALAGRELLNVGPSSHGGSDEFGIVPLGMPLIAGPALLTALLVLVDTVGIVFTLASLLVNLGLGRTGVLECRPVRALDGHARITRRIENSRAPPRRDCCQPHPSRLEHASLT